MDKERFEEIKSLVNQIEEIYFVKRKREEASLLIDSLYGRCDVDWLISTVEEQQKEIEMGPTNDMLLYTANRVIETEKENARLQKEIERLKADAQFHKGYADRFSDDNKRLRKELEDIRDIATGFAHVWAKQALAGESK